MSVYSGGNKFFFFSLGNFSVFSYDMPHSFPIIYQNNMWIASLLPFLKDCLKEKSMVRKAQKMGSDVESGVMTELQIERIFRRRDMVKNTSEINPKSLQHV